MLLYRVFPHDPSATAGQTGHPDVLYPGQGAGRWDNPDKYVGWYLVSSATAAIGEVFGDLSTWSESMFDFPAKPGVRRALGTYSLPDSTPLMNLDDANALVARSLRPTQVVSPNRRATQQIALDIFNETTADGQPRWVGLTWWSSRCSTWPAHFVWGAAPLCQGVETLSLEHMAVQDAATALAKAV